MLSVQSITNCLAPGSHVMWNMPSMVPGMPPPVLFTVPDCQNPPRSAWLFTELVVLPPGPMGLAGIMPSQDHSPLKYATCAISAAGLGASILAAGLAPAGAAGAWANTAGAER